MLLSTAMEGRRSPKLRAGSARVAAVVAACALVAAMVIGLGAYGAWSILAEPVRNLFGTGVERWPTIEHIELELDLSAPPRFAGSARLRLGDVKDRHVAFLLNRDLDVTGVIDDEAQVVLSWKSRSRLHSRYHREARVIEVDLGRDPDPEGEDVLLEVRYAGTGADGTGDRDWRGILMLADDELRMSEQSVFYPQVPIDVDGPGIRRCTAEVTVTVPEDFELFMPGESDCQDVFVERGQRTVCFSLTQPTVLGLVAGRYVRHERVESGFKLVSLMKPERAELGPELIREASRICAYFEARFGSIADFAPASGTELCVVEIDCRGDNSYNWASNGLVVFDGPALDGGVPVAKLAHEVAHLWWGQAIRAHGPGERFLTEGLAEYSSWRWLAEAEGEAAAGRAAREGRERYMRTVHANGADPALAEVGFDTPGYTDLAYRKGALVMRYAEAVLGKHELDRRLAAYVKEFAWGAPTLGDFATAVAGTDEDVAVLLPWLDQGGHAHLELKNVEVVDAAASGMLAATPCPNGIERLAPAGVVLRFAAAESVVDRLQPLASDATPFRQDLSELEAIVVDPRATFPLAGPVVHSPAPVMILRSEPAEGAADVPFALERITLEFSRALASPELQDVRDALHRGARELKLGYAPVGSVELSWDGRTLGLVLSHPLSPDREVAVRLDGALFDVHGVPVSADLRFRTVASDDDEPPRVVATVPESNADSVDPDLVELRIVFSEPMQVGRGYGKSTVRALERDGWRFPALGDSRWVEGGTVLVYELETPLAAGTKYALPLRSVFKDLAGNGLEGHDFRFATR